MHKEGWVSENWCFQIVVLQKTLVSPLGSKEIKSANPKGNQPWVLIGRTDAEAEAPMFWPPDTKSQLIGKDPDSGKEWRQEEKGMTEDETVRWDHKLNEHDFEQTPGDQKRRGKSWPWCQQNVGHDLVKHTILIILKWHLLVMQTLPLPICKFSKFQNWNFSY